MPKTFTDDVAAALPSSIEGPFQVLDPTDHDSWIKLDPAGAGVAAAGAARPKRRIIRAILRTYGLTYTDALGTGYSCRRVTATGLAGTFYAPFPIPPDMDLAAPSDIKLIIAAAVDATTNGQAIRFRVDVTHFKPGEAPNDATIAYDWPVPDDWTANDPREVAIDNGTGAAFDANHFEDGDQVGLLIRRDGAATEDTFDKNILICDAMTFEYSAKVY